MMNRLLFRANGIEIDCISNTLQTLKYKSEKFELLTYSATTALINNKIPLAASNLKNHLKPEDI